MVTIQHLDVTQASVQQVWQWRTVDRVGQVDVRGQMRLHDVVLGFDVEAVIDDRERRYSSTFTHRLLSFDFSVSWSREFLIYEGVNRLKGWQTSFEVETQSTN